MSEVVTIGETMALLRAPAPGRLRDMTSLRLSAAGAESNVAIGLVRLGHRASWIGRVGDDELGRMILTRLRGEDVDVSRAVVDSAQTALMLRERRTPAVDRVTYYRRGYAGSRLQPEDLDENLLRNARIVHLTGITPALSESARATVYAAVDIAHSAGVLVTFDLNYRSALWSIDEAASQLWALANQADVVFAGEDELRVLERASSGTAARELSANGERTVVVKKGAAGASSIRGGALYEQAAPAVQAVDPVGAGDAFVAGYISALLDGRDEAGRLALGCAVGAHAVTVAGDWEGLPDRDDLTMATMPEGTILR